MRGPPREQEDSQRRNYTVLPLCPMAAVDVTTVPVPVLFWRRLVHSKLFLVVFILATFLRVLTKNSESSIVVFIVMPEHDFVKKFLICVF